MEGAAFSLDRPGPRCHGHGEKSPTMGFIVDINSSWIMDTNVHSLLILYN